MDDNKHSKKIRKVPYLLLFSVFLLGAGFFSGQALERSSKLSDFSIPYIFDNKKADFSTIKNVWDIIHTEYVDTDNIDDEALIFGAIRGMLNELGDPHSMFFDREETSQFIDSVTGKFEGVGIEITVRDGELVVISPLKDSPALKAGIRAGDKITAIDGESAADITLEEAVVKIRGPKGTSVVLTVVHEDSGEETDIRITRDTIEVPTISWEMLGDNIAYIEIAQFSENTDVDFEEAVQEILTTSADGIILDLRNNPGGFLDVAVNIGSWLLPEGETIVIEKRQQDSTRIHRSKGPGLLYDFPIVVLQNAGSASASEILAGALRDQKSSPIVGGKSFGKGSVQAFEDLPGGTSIKLTVAHWVTPSGQYINDEGIEPTFEVELSEQDIEEGNDPQKEKAIEIMYSLR